MSAGLLMLTAWIYLGVAVGYAREDRYGMAVAFVCYALANLAFAYDSRLR